jgi:hypothetical protein
MLSIWELQITNDLPGIVITCCVSNNMRNISHILQIIKEINCQRARKVHKQNVQIKPIYSVSYQWPCGFSETKCEIACLLLAISRHLFAVILIRIEGQSSAFPKTGGVVLW